MQWEFRIQRGRWLPDFCESVPATRPAPGADRTTIDAINPAAVVIARNLSQRCSRTRRLRRRVLPTCTYLTEMTVLIRVPFGSCTEEIV